MKMTGNAKLTLTLSLLLATGFATACGGSDEDTTETGFDDKAIIVGFADNVVVPTYAALDQAALELTAAVEDLAADPTHENLIKCQDLWIAAREPWEQSEGFLFGPVDSFGYDPAMDSWPVNHTDLESVLASGDEFTPDYVRNLAETQKGFHTIEYLLFGLENDQQVASLDQREMDYLIAITKEFAEVANLLHTAWTVGPIGGVPYRDVFATAGEPGNTAYPSLLSAAQEIVGGMSGICDEVANGKIAGPFDAQDPNLVESQFSFLSQIDFQNNMRSVLFAYRGYMGDGAATQRGLSDYIREQDPELDARMLTEIDNAINMIGAIPAPFRDAITDEAAAESITQAQTAVRTVFDTIETDLRIYVQ